MCGYSVISPFLCSGVMLTEDHKMLLANHITWINLVNKNIRVRPEMETSHSGCPRTACCVVNIFQENRVSPWMRTNGTKVYGGKGLQPCSCCAPLEVLNPSEDLLMLMDVGCFTDCCNFCFGLLRWSQLCVFRPPKIPFIKSRPDCHTRMRQSDVHGFRSIFSG